MGNVNLINCFKDGFNKIIQFNSLLILIAIYVMFTIASLFITASIEQTSEITEPLIIGSGLLIGIIILIGHGYLNVKIIQAIFSNINKTQLRFNHIEDLKFAIIITLLIVILPFFVTEIINMAGIVGVGEIMNIVWMILTLFFAIEYVIGQNNIFNSLINSINLIYRNVLLCIGYGMIIILIAILISLPIHVYVIAMATTEMLENPEMLYNPYYSIYWLNAVVFGIYTYLIIIPTKVILWNHIRPNQTDIENDEINQNKNVPNKYKKGKKSK